MSSIYIVPIKTSPRLWLEPLTAGILSAFGIHGTCAKVEISLARAFDLARRQYNSSQILLQLIASSPADAPRILGVTEVDLFIPILTFVFGEAQLDGIGAVVSLHRLDNRFYGLPEDQGLLVQRLVKESIHELGHTFGLLHCIHPGCVLNASTYVEDIDQKSEELCQHCQQQLKVTRGLRAGKETQ